jgi:hypothetical protein
MHTHHLKEMVRVLRPSLKDPLKAQAILERYWRDRKAIVWEIKDVHRAANERALVLRNTEARQILQQLMDGYSRYDSRKGIHWLRLLEIIDESCLGRKITRQEMKRFLENDHIAIQR